MEAFAGISGGRRNARIRQGQDGNVIFLDEFLRRCGQSGGGYSIAEHFADAVEAEKLAYCVLGLGHAIGHEHPRVGFRRLEMEHGEVYFWIGALRQRAFDRQFLPIQIRRQMAGVDQRTAAVTLNAQSKPRYKATT